jgi:hypothetical protein
MKIMRVSLIAALLATTSLSAFADTSSMNGSVTGMGILENDYVKAGVNGTSGTFGSGGNTSPGLLFDSTGTGTFNTSYDYLTPGSPFDGWSIKIDGVNTTNNNGGGGASWTDSDGLSDTTDGFTWQGTNSDYAGWQVEHNYSLGATSQFIDIETNITAGSSASDSTVYFGRFIDPDARAADGDSSSTDNVLGYSGIPDSNVAFSEALSSRYALGLYSTNSNVDAGITGWSSEADAYTENAVDGDGSLTNTGDNTIGLTWVWSGVQAGDILTAEYAYIFGPSAFDAADEAIDGGAGGGTPGETPSGWEAVEDVGSATDAASGPTVVGTGTSSITSHTATETATTQTIAREKATSTWDVYSDGSLGTAAVTTETLAPFTGRIDQIATAQDIVGVVIKGLEFNGITAIGNKSKYKNGMSGETKGASIGGTRVSDTGMIVGLGAASVKTELKSDDANRSTATTKAAQIKIGREIGKNSISLKLKHAIIDYSMERSIGDFAAAGSTKGTDTSISLMLEGSGKIAPIVGFTKGRSAMDSYTETGDIQAVRTVAKTTENYNYGTLGAKAKLGVLDIALIRHSDNTNQAKIGINKTTEKGSSFGINYTKTKTGLGTTDSIVAGLTIKF